MILRSKYFISNELYLEALVYADKSKKYTSNRHDFHSGGLTNKKQKMFEGKLGEKAFKMFLEDNNINYIEDPTSYKERDKFDFLLLNRNEKLKVDVKTRTEIYHIRTLELVEQAKNHPKDIFISARLYREKRVVVLLGWFFYDDMITKNQIENQGYLDNYVMYDKDLRPMKDLETLVLSRFRKEK